MPATNLLIVHFSDLHIRTVEDAILKRAKQLAAATYSQLPQVENVLIAVSGDIAWSGRAEEYTLASEFLDEFVSEIHKESPNVRVDIVVCPGNHDVDFREHDEVRDAVLAKVRAIGTKDVSSKLIAAATAVQDNFFAFRERVSTLALEFDNKLVWEHRIQVGAKSIGIRCLNVAWMSELREKQGALHFPEGMIKAFDHGNKRGLNVTVLHHPFNWYSQSSYQAFKSAVRHESHMVFTGHEHYQNVGETHDIHSSPSIFVEGGVLFETADQGATSTFNLVLVDLEDERYVSGLYSWNGERYFPSVDDSEWGSLRPLPSKGHQRYPLTENFVAQLDDPGARFIHPAKKSLSISDIFVWPDLLFLDDSSVVKRQQSASMFESLDNIKHPGILIKGDEKLGKTTLLLQYFRSYHSRGFLPLYVNGAWLQRQHLKEPLKAINFALDRQYARSGHDAFHQEARDKKVLLLDDLHKSKLSGEALSDVLKVLFNHFGAVLLCAKDGPEALDLLSVDRVPALQELGQFEIREFGHKKRYELVRRWVAIGDSADEGSKEWMAMIDKSEKDLTTAVGRQLVPAVPIFLLTLLQSAEAKRPADLQNSALGHYYHYLITSSLELIGVQRDQWSEIFNYCSNLAWTLYSASTKQLSDSEIVEFSAAYSKEFTPIAPGRRLKELIDAGILTCVDDVYHFRYPYLYYMFLGQYLAEHIHEPEVDQVISRLCEDMHLRDNSNILLFVSHHTRSPIIYERIGKTLEACFADKNAFNFAEDVQAINRLIEKAPELLFDDTPGHDKRAEMREHQDRMDDAAQPTDDSQIGSAASVTRLFRGMEILGQFLKNHYGTARNQVKNELIQVLVQSGLRGLNGIAAVLVEQTDALSDMVERAIREGRNDIAEHERRQIARQVIFDLIGMIAFAFVQKTSSCVGSEFLKGNIAEVSASANTLGHRIIEMSHQLDLPEAIPFERLKALRKEMDNNLFGTALLRSLALRHLHMFKVSFKDKQRLCSELGINLSCQLAIQFDRAKR